MRGWSLLLLLFVGRALSAQEAPIRLERVVRIGCVECTGPELFAGIQDLAVTRGRIYVTDRVAPFIRVFDTQGRALRGLGGRGRGPGEFALPIHLGVRSNGGLEVYDMNLRRFTRFDSAGAVVQTRAITEFAALVTSTPGGTDSYLLTTDFATVDQPILRLPDGAREPQKLVTLTAEFPRHAPGEHARTPAFAARPAGGFAVGDGIAEYRIRIYDRAGQPLNDIVRAIPKPTKTAAELELEKQQMQKRAARMQAMLRAEGGGSPPAFKPREERNHFNIDGIQFDESGRLWVRTERGGASATVFDIFDASSRYLGQLRVAERLGTFALGDGMLAAKVTDAEEVEYVGVWRVR